MKNQTSKDKIKELESELFLARCQRDIAMDVIDTFLSGSVTIKKMNDARLAYNMLEYKRKEEDTK